LLGHRQREARADEVAAAASGERAKGVVGIGDALLAVMADDQVALRLGEALGALLPATITSG
jgi:hypothetical protein